MRTVQVTLKDYLDTHGLTAYRLAEAARGRVSRGAVYALARGNTGRVDLGTLGAVITTLEELTGQEVTPGELLTAYTLPERDEETRAWMDSDLSGLGRFEPYDFEGLDPYTMGEPVRVTADGRILIGGE